MTVGETLTRARSEAGLSVDELSERTRIRETVIRSIEQDDYAACGGDLYVHGYVRAIAGAVGIDAQPLIREYDLGRASDPGERVNDPFARPAAQTSFDLPAVTADPAAGGAPASAVGLDTTRYDLPPLRAESPATSYDLPRVPEEPGTAEDLMAAGYDLPPTAEPGAAGSATAVSPAPGPDPAGSQPPAVWTAPRLGGGTGQADLTRTRTARKKRRGFLAVTAAVVVLAAAVLSIRLATEGGTTIKSTAATSVPSPSASAAARARAAAQASASAAARASAAAQASANAKASQKAAAARAAAQRVVTLPVASAAAFGPDGFADGDDPSGARNAIARNASQPWSTQWYDTATFGLLKHGTGLLLDLGAKVTVTSVRLDLSQDPGADLQLRVGNGTAAQDLKLAATASSVSGSIKLTLPHPVSARYLLIWFTQLAANGSGQYEETVSHVAVSGQR